MARRAATCFAVVAWALVALAAIAPAAADDEAAEFFRGKTISIIVGYAPGGGYDQSARLLSRHFGKHIPGRPNVVVQKDRKSTRLNSSH